MPERAQAGNEETLGQPLVQPSQCRGIEAHRDVDSVKPIIEYASGDNGHIETSQPFATPPTSTTDPVIEEIEAQTGVVPENLRVTVITHGPDALNKLTETIASAETRIDLKAFLWWDDESGRTVTDALLEVKKRNKGMPISVTVDRLGCIAFAILKPKPLRALGILASKIPRFLFELVRQRIWPWTFIRGALTYFRPHLAAKHRTEREAFSSVFGALFSRADLLRYNSCLMDLEEQGITVHVSDNSGTIDQDHAKRYRVDETIMTGGMNIGDIAMGPKAWDDYFISLDQEESQSSAPVTSVHRLRNEPGIHAEKQITDTMYTLINKATDTIYIECAFIDDASLKKHLIDALKRGVKVIILLGAAKGDFSREDSPFIRELKKANPSLVRIENSNSIQHSKLLIVDGKYVLVGSANFNRQSLHEHGEDAVLMIREEGQDLEAAPQVIFDQSQKRLSNATT